MIWSKFYPRGKFYPDEASKLWKFVRIDRDPQPRYLSWTGTNFDGMEFMWRNWDFIPNQLIKDPRREDTFIRQIHLLKECCSSEDYGVVFKVVTKSGGEHWLAGVGKSVLGWATNDPWDGRRLWKSAGYLATYPRIVGWALMKKSE
jgi:hypothetical protein